MNDIELRHHGILGMHWGQRRYQNKDGTLTPAGVKRYVDKEDEDDISPTRTVSAISDEDLQRIVTRMNLEKSYRDLLKQQYPEKKPLQWMKDLTERGNTVKDFLKMGSEMYDNAKKIERAVGEISKAISSRSVGAAVEAAAKTAVEIGEVDKKKKSENGRSAS